MDWFPRTIVRNDSIAVLYYCDGDREGIYVANFVGNPDRHGDRLEFINGSLVQLDDESDRSYNARVEYARQFLECVRTVAS